MSNAHDILEDLKEHIAELRGTCIEFETDLIQIIRKPIDEASEGEVIEAKQKLNHIHGQLASLAEVEQFINERIIL